MGPERAWAFPGVQAGARTPARCMLLFSNSVTCRAAQRAGGFRVLLSCAPYNTLGRVLLVAAFVSQCGTVRQGAQASRSSTALGVGMGLSVRGGPKRVTYTRHSKALKGQSAGLWGK